MKLYKITLRLFEKSDDSDFAEDEPSQNIVQLLTIAKSLSDASDYCVKSYEKADGPMEDGFYYKAIAGEEIEGSLAIPTLKEIKPKTR